MFYIFIMCGGFWVCNRAAVVDGGGVRLSPHSRFAPMWGRTFAELNDYT